MAESIKLDETDIQILEILQENCKLNYTQIGNELGIAESTIRYRIERLEKRRIING
ncbi:AsnC family transcriptional regulator, partial [Candidatus Bathyarchaeota archaeon]|nr:AsnC family transcriptional regulator [Candidatus Bathyarchaeota archaeon]